MLYVKDLYKSYQVGKTAYPVLNGISLQVAQGEFTAVMGPSGSGKSTLLNCISCYIPFEEGKITLGGQELKGLDARELARVRNEKLGFVFQDFMLLDGLTVRENVLVPKIIEGTVSKEDEERCVTLLKLFGIYGSGRNIRQRFPAERNSGPPWQGV